MPIRIEDHEVIIDPRIAEEVDPSMGRASTQSQNRILRVDEFAAHAADLEASFKAFREEHPSRDAFGVFIKMRVSETSMRESQSAFDLFATQDAKRASAFVNGDFILEKGLTFAQFADLMAQDVGTVRPGYIEQEELPPEEHWTNDQGTVITYRNRACFGVERFGAERSGAERSGADASTHVKAHGSSALGNEGQRPAPHSSPTSTGDIAGMQGMSPAMSPARRVNGQGGLTEGPTQSAAQH